MTNEEFLRKFDAHEEFSEKEIEDMCWGFIGECVSEDIIEQGDWTIYKRTVFKVNSRFFGVYWTDGATEQQEDCREFPDYPTELRRVEKMVYDYVPIEENK